MEKMQKLNEASIKGQNRKTGESFGMVIGSDKKNREGNFELTIRVMYSSRISAYKLTFNSNNELINVLDYGYSMDGKAPDVTKSGGSGKSVKLDKRKTITFIAKLTSPAFASKIYKHLQKVNESVNEGYGPFIKAKNLNDIIKLSKQKKNATFYVTYDNNSRIGTFYLKNGKFAKATTANPNYDLQRNKTKLKDRSDVIYKYKVDESVNEAYVVLYSPKKGVKPVTTAAYKDKKDAEKWAKDLGGITMIVKKKVKGIDEGKKRYYQQDRVGSAKYTISYHDGKKKHKDGSDFFDIQTFKNKKDLAKFVNTLHKGGYVYGFNESVNEGISVFDERPIGKNGLIIMIDDNGKKVSAIFKNKKNSYKYNRNNPAHVKKLLQLAKKTKFPKAIDEKTYGISDDNPVQFEAKYNYKADALTAYFKGKIDAKELDSIARNQFKSGIATKKELSNFLSNKFTQDVMSDTYGIPAGTLVKRVRGLMKFAEGMNEDKKQVKDLVKKVKFEKIFYDVLSTMEKKFGKRKYRMWLEKSLKDFGENPKHYDYRTNAAIEEKLFQLGK